MALALSLNSGNRSIWMSLILHKNVPYVSYSLSLINPTECIIRNPSILRVMCGGNFDYWIDKQFIGRFPCYTILATNTLSNIIVNIPTTTGITRPHYQCFYSSIIVHNRRM